MGSTPTRERRTLRYPPSIEKPKDWLRFIQGDLFEKCWSHLGLEDEDLQALETLIMLNPDGHPVIPGTGGIRKLRFSSEDWPQGKSGAARVYYLHIPGKGIVWLVYVHRKSELGQISESGKKEMRQYVQIILNCFE